MFFGAMISSPRDFEDGIMPEQRVKKSSEEMVVQRRTNDVHYLGSCRTSHRTQHPKKAQWHATQIYPQAVSEPADPPHIFSPNERPK